jgi:hypothetical protein
MAMDWRDMEDMNSTWVHNKGACIGVDCEPECWCVCHNHEGELLR